MLQIQYIAKSVGTYRHFLKNEITLLEWGPHITYGFLFYYDSTLFEMVPTVINKKIK